MSIITFCGFICFILRVERSFLKQGQLLITRKKKMATLTIQEIIDKLESDVGNYQKFRIGKTGQAARECFNELYSEEYSFITELVHSDEPRSVDRYEREIIKHFKSYPNNKNEQDDDGEMRRSEKYIVYVVWS